MKLHYPFSAVVGNHTLKQALCLCVIDPSIGGVLIEGDRGSAKSTLSRGLAQLISHGSFINLPLGASEEQLIGSLDIAQVLSNSEVKFRPGLLAKADQGILYIDEVNLLADHLTDVLLDVAASGTNIVERDGVSHQHTTRFVLVGSMNPDEGTLRPQLLDRFGLSVLSQTPQEMAERKQVVKSRLNFELNPEQFIEKFKTKQSELKQQLQQARLSVSNVELSELMQDYIVQVCSQASCEGLRADITLTKIARANAAFRGDGVVNQAHVDEVKELVLRHRRRETQPLQPKKRRPPDQQQKPQKEQQTDTSDHRHNVSEENVNLEYREKKH